VNEVGNVGRWARATDTGVGRALAAIEHMPTSSTGKGLAVPYPFRDRAPLKAAVSNREMNSLIASAPKRTIPLEGLHAIQHSVSAEKLREHLLHPIEPGATHPKTGTPVDLPIVVQHEGIRSIWDGHHRLVAAKLRGASSAKVRFVDLDSESGSADKRA
jgi:hypothetical protein